MLLHWCERGSLSTFERYVASRAQLPLHMAILAHMSSSSAVNSSRLSYAVPFGVPFQVLFSFVAVAPFSTAVFDESLTVEMSELDLLATFCDCVLGI